MALMAAAVSACCIAWWRPSGWFPEEPEEKAVEATPDSCTHRFIFRAAEKTKHYRMGCMNHRDLGSGSEFLQINSQKSRNGRMLEEECLLGCFNEALSTTEVDTSVVFKSVRAAFEPLHIVNIVKPRKGRQKASQGRCYCAGVQQGPFGPSEVEAGLATGRCPIFLLELPLACLYQTKQACLAAPEDSCGWSDRTGCCYDLMGDSALNSALVSDLRTIAVMNGVFALCFSLAAMLWCLCSIRRLQARRQAALARYAPFADRLSRQLASPSARGFASESDYTNVAIALHDLAQNMTEDLLDSTTSSEGALSCVVCLETGRLPEGASTSQVPEHEMLEKLIGKLYTETSPSTKKRLLRQNGEEDNTHVTSSSSPSSTPSEGSHTSQVGEAQLYMLPFEGWAVLGCGHRLHFFCVEKWFLEQAKKKKPPSCPVCRTAVQLTSKTVPHKKVYLRVEQRDLNSPSSSSSSTTAASCVLSCVQVYPQDTLFSLIEKAIKAGLPLSPECTVHLKTPSASAKIYGLVEPDMTIFVTDPNIGRAADNGVTEEEERENDEEKRARDESSGSPQASPMSVSLPPPLPSSSNSPDNETELTPSNNHGLSPPHRL